MGGAERVATLIVIVALATTLVLPDRKTAQVFGVIGQTFTNAIQTAMGR